MLALRVMGLVVVLVLVGGCVGGATSVRGSGRLVTEEYDLAGFTRVAAGGAFQVEITQADNFSVLVTSDDNVTERLDIRVRGDTLHIGLTPGLILGLNNVTLRAEVTLPALAAVELSGATTGTLAGFSSQDSLDVEVTGASTLTGDVTAGDMRFDVTGASTARLDGQAQDLDIEASGASTVDLEEMPAQDVRAEANGASRIVVNVNGRLDAQASGASTVRYVGEPTVVNSDASGASSVGPR